MKKQHAVVTLFLLILTGITLACTSFVLSGEHPFLAKNLDWELDRGYLHFNLAGIKKNSISDPNLKWISKYNSITNNQFGKEFPLGGMNEAGLVIEELSLFGQAYETDISKQNLNEFQWVQYQLDNSASVIEVIESLGQITIKHNIMNLHYLIADKTGDVAVIECLKTGVRIYYENELPYKTLSNNNYKESIRYLGFFEGYGGTMEILHRPGSQERFVSAVSMLDDFKSESDPMNYCFTILNTVKQEDTRWQFVYDPYDLKIHCKTHDSSKTFEIGFKELKKVRHNRFAVTLSGGVHQQIKMGDHRNKKQLKYVHGQLEAYFPEREHVYEMLIEEGSRSLKAK